MSDSTVTTKTKFISPTNQFCIRYYYEGSSYYTSPKNLQVGLKFRANLDAIFYRIIQKLSNEGEHFFIVEREGETKDEKEHPKMLILGYKESDPPFEIARRFYGDEYRMGKIVSGTCLPFLSSGRCLNGHTWMLYGKELDYTLGFTDMKSLIVLDPMKKEEPKVEPKKMKYTYLYNLSGNWGVWVKSGDMGYQLTKPEQLKEGMVISSRETPGPLNAIIRQKWEASDSFAFRIEKEDKSTQLLIYPKEGPPIEYLVNIGVYARIVGKKCRPLGVGATRLVCTDINGNSYERIWNAAAKAKQHYAISGLTDCWCTEAVEEEPVQKTPKKGFIVDSKPTRLQIFRGSQNVDIILNFKDVKQSDILKRSDGELFFVMSYGEGKTVTEEYRSFTLQKLNYSPRSPVEYYTLAVDSNGNETLKEWGKYVEPDSKPIQSKQDLISSEIQQLRNAVYSLAENILKGQQTLIKGQTILQETLEDLSDDSDLQQMIDGMDELDFSDPSKDKVLFADRVRRLITDSLIAVIKINSKPTIHDVVKEMNERLD